MVITGEHLIIFPSGAPITGRLVPPADKSITHRALFFGALNNGITIIHNPSPAADCRSTFSILRELGYGVRAIDNQWEVYGVESLGPIGAKTLDCGNSGTTARLAAGLLTGERGTFTLTGDASLTTRPMERVASPLRRLGADINTTDGYLPAIIRGNGAITGLGDTGINVASAQVHAALVFAAIRSERGAIIRRGKPMRDHTIRMARYFGTHIEGHEEYGAPVDQVYPTRIDCDPVITIPGDISSASFAIAAALLVPGSHLRIEGVGLNPTRTAFLASLATMGAMVRWEATDDTYEPTGWVEAEYSPEMQGITLGSDVGSSIPVAEMIDELPLLVLIASQAHGVTIVRDAAELRVKESDRISATARVLRSFGIVMTELDDGFRIEGGQTIKGGHEGIHHHGDHRLCMMAAVAALAADAPVTIINPEVADISYPRFWHDLETIAGCRLERTR